MKERKDCFFGVHFDFHAQKDTIRIGRDFDEKPLENFIERVRPDFIQCDTKGHAGYSSYPTKIGTSAPDIARDVLKAWREVTARHGVLLYAHHSGVYDVVASEEHPEWAMQHKDGKTDVCMSFFGEYADKRLIPQLIEMGKDYGLNGAWIDGECWSFGVDYSEKAKRAWVKFSGYDIPEENDENWMEFLNFQRQAFFDYITHYIRETKKICPDFEITSNWCNTSYVPSEFYETDFISGDLASLDSAYSARFEGRYIADYNKVWDLMAWGFRMQTGVLKSSAQMCQELACIMSIGGRVQVYYQQDPYGTVVDFDVVTDRMQEIAAFCRERQPYCMDSSMLPTIGVILSGEMAYQNPERPFAPWLDKYPYINGVRGITSCVLDGANPAEVLRGASIPTRDLSGYDALILTDVTKLETGIKEKLLSYAQEGGNIILSGECVLRMFADDLSLSIGAKVEGKTRLYWNGWVDQVYGSALSVSCKNGLQEIGRLVTEMRQNGERVLAESAACYQLSHGKGQIFLMPFDVGHSYFNMNSAYLCEFFSDILKECHCKLQVTGSRYATVSLMKKDNVEYVHVVNMSGLSRANMVSTFTEILPIPCLDITYRVDKKPKAVYLQPEGKAVYFEYQAGVLKLQLKNIAIHNCFEIKY